MNVMRVLQALLVHLTLTLPATAGDFPEIVKVRVNSRAIPRVFPAGTEMRVMPIAEFERLEAKAREAAAERGEQRITVVRARHVARWDGERLTGRSELLVHGAKSQNDKVLIEPWSPALIGDRPQDQPLRVGSDRKLSVQVGRPGDQTLALNWEQNARPGTHGMLFDLALPSLPSCRLELDLPKGIDPEAVGMTRQPSIPGSEPGRQLWKFDGPGGIVRVMLKTAKELASPDNRSWVESRTIIDATTHPPRWKSEWSFDPGAQVPSQITLKLDPGLELIEVSGPIVTSYRAQPSIPGEEDTGTQLTIRLDETSSSASTISLKAICRSDPETTWLLPSAKPQGVTWLGGRTIVYLGKSTSLSAVRELAGRQVAPRADEVAALRADQGLVLAFEAEASESVAELTLKNTSSQVSAEVRGQLILSDQDASRIEAQITWKIERGRLLSMSADLPAGWSPERAQIVGADEPTSWHSETLPGGGTRVVVRPPLASEPTASVALDIVAAATVTDRLGTLQLPRVTPEGVRTTDEVWLLRGEPGVAVTPIRARGLAWLDPLKTNWTALDDSQRKDPGVPILAWRWTAADGLASLTRSAIATEVQSEAWVFAQVSGNRVSIDYYLSWHPEKNQANDLVVGTSSSIDQPLRWEVVGQPGRLISADPIPKQELGQLGFPETGQAARFPVPKDFRERQVFHAHLDRPWTGSGEIPLLVLPSRQMARGVLLVSVGRGMRSEVLAETLTPQDTAWSRRAAITSLGVPAIKSEGTGPSQYRMAHAFGYRHDAGRVVLNTEFLEPATMGTVVDEAILRSRSAEVGPSHHELTLQVANGPQRVMEFEITEPFRLERARLDGRAFIPVREGSTIRFPLPAGLAEATTTEVVLEYEGPFSPSIPRCSLPILSFVWCAASTDASRIILNDASLALTDPEGMEGQDWGRIDGFWDASPGEDARAADSALKFARRAQAVPAVGRELADWLIQIDAGTLPVVVDRLSLLDHGVGPRTRFAMERDPVSEPSVTPLSTLGLQAIPMPGLVLVTSSPGIEFTTMAERESWEDVLRIAARDGRDPTDRFQSIARWVDEPTPRVPSGRSNLGERDTPVRSIARFVASDAPSSRHIPTLIRSEPPILLVLSGITLFILLAILFRIQLIWGIAGLGLVLTTAAVLMRWAPTQLDDLASTICLASLAASGYGLVVHERRRSGRESQRSSLSRRSRIQRMASRVGMIILIMAVSLPSDLNARQSVDGSRSRIVIMLPYDSPLDLGSEPTQAVMTLSDYEVLARMTKPETGEPGQAWLADAQHELRRVGGRDVLFASALDLWCDTDAASTWSFSTNGVRDISATLDGQAVPVAVDSVKRTGTVRIKGVGSHRVILRRLASLERVGGEDRLSVAIPPLASARLRVEVSPGSTPPSLPSARGSSRILGTIVESILGPISVLEVRWIRHNLVGPPILRTNGETLALWDIEPAGDRIRLRLKATDPEGLAQVAIRLDPEIQVGSVIAPGVALQTSRIELGTQVAWQTQMDPPLPQGESILVELWSPRSEDSDLRQLPVFEVLSPLDPEAVIGVRRPDDWEGRVEPGDGLTLVPDDTFARSWGPLPPGSATLAGAARLTTSGRLSLATGPAPPLARVRPSVFLTLSPGRLDVSCSTEWITISGTTRQVEALIPGDLQVNYVEAQGLTNWTRISDTSLQLRFDADMQAPSKTIRITGSIPMDGDPLSPGLQKGEMEVPWVSWPGNQYSPGLLTIAAPSGLSFQLDPNPGVESVAPAPVPGASLVAAYSFPSNRTPGRISWVVEPTGVNVRVQSLIALHPSSVDWTASAHYLVASGPCPPIRLRLPTSWADVSRVEIVGSPTQPTIERGPDITTWTLVPDPPMWGGVKVRIRGTKPRAPDEFLDFPNLVPLGRAPVDRVESYVGYMDVSGSSTIVEGSANLQAVENSRWNEADLPWPPAASPNVYRVMAENWSLRFGPPVRWNSPETTGGSPVVTHASISCTLDPEGVLTGCAVLSLEGQPSAFLPVMLPTSAVPLVASVDGVVVRLRRDRSGQILVPLPEFTPSTVQVVWRQSWDSQDEAGGNSLEIPWLKNALYPALIEFSAPESITVNSPLREVTSASMELARAQNLVRRISASLPSIDRGSKTQLSILLGDCIRFAMMTRTIERAAVSPSGLRSAAMIQTIATLQAELEESLAAAGLSACLQSARVRVGAPGNDPMPDQGVINRSADRIRIRPIGLTHSYRIRPGESFSLTWKERTVARSAAMSTWPVLVVGLSFLFMIYFARFRPRTVSAALPLLPTSVALLAGGGWMVPIVLSVGGVAAALSPRPLPERARGD